jgi:hypothetical protein
MTLAAASKLLEISYRQAKRVWARYQAEGDRGLVHRLRGKPSNRQGNGSLKRRVLARYAKAYGD